MTYEQYLRESGLSIPEASKFIARARDSDRPANATVWRWCKRGIQVRGSSAVDSAKPQGGPDIRGRKVWLDYLRIGKQIRTTQEAVNRFLEATQDNFLPTPSAEAAVPVPTPVVDATRVAKAAARVAAFMTTSPKTGPQRRQKAGKEPASSGCQAGQPSEKAKSVIGGKTPIAP